ncbi:MAG: DUF438 domain-containing protein [Bacilli bacterium]|jgi:DUF438 domain-containing protein|nr:DUF438 domain-containing protein [Bacilli bacterium]
MSELINNSKQRQALLKDLIKKIHQGMDINEAKKEFKKHFETISTDEIMKMEQGLIREGMAIAEVQRLCDVHAAVFEGSISDIHRAKDLTKEAGHPVQVFLAENDRIENLIKNEIEPYLVQSGKSALLMLRVGIDRLAAIHNHYARKEYLFFPNLEKKGITAPPKVMWGVDDEIRADLKAVQEGLNSPDTDEVLVKGKIEALLQRIRDMIVKENNILVPMLLENLSYFDWILVDASSPEIGYFLEQPKQGWKKKKTEEKEEAKENIPEELVRLPSGNFTLDELDSLLNTLPLDITFVDKEGHVRYFTQGRERIFDRPLTILGRHVSMCHPPASVHVVEEIIESFKSGAKDHEDFWIRMKGAFVYIRYFAIRNRNNEYLGTLEITQNIKEITELEGEKRLISK